MSQEELVAIAAEMRADVLTVESVARPDFNYGVNAAAALVETLQNRSILCGDECVNRAVEAIRLLQLDCSPR